MMIQVPPGEMRHRVQVITVAEGAKDALGQPVVSTTAGNYLWGKVSPLEGRESYEAKQVNPLVTHRFNSWYDSTVVPKARLLFGSRTFEIESVLNPDERSAQLVAILKEEV